MKAKNKAILDIFSEKGAYITAADLKRSAQLYRQLKALLASGAVEKIANGLYRHLAFPAGNDMAELAKQYPSAVFCMYSAWSFYELSTVIPKQYCLALRNKSKIKTADFPPIKVYYWTDFYFELEIEELNGIRIYSIEKSVCDAVKFRNKIGKALMAEILNNYLKRKDKDLNKLYAIAQKMSVDKLLHEYLNMII